MIKGTYAGCLWVLYTYLLTVGYFVHQWDVRAEELPEAFHVSTPFSCLQIQLRPGLSVFQEWIWPIHTD